MGEPRWQAIREDIARRIRSGEYPVGAPIPSLKALADTWGVNLSTAQRAVRFLREAGILEGRPGVDVRVARVPDEGEQIRTVEQRLADVEAWIRDHDANHPHQ